MLTPMPIPAFAPVDSPDEWFDCLGLELAEVLDVVFVAEVIVTAFVGFVVGLPENTVPTTLYAPRSLFHVAHTFGCFGKTLNLPTPESQQPFV